MHREMVLMVCVCVCLSFGFIFIIEEEERDTERNSTEVQILMFLIWDQIIIFFLFVPIYEVGREDQEDILIWYMIYS